MISVLFNFQIIMEEESQFLSKETDKIERIQSFLNKILNDLNEKGMSTVVGKYNFSVD